MSGAAYNVGAAVFILFFGGELLNAISQHHVRAAVLWLLAGALFGIAGHASHERSLQDAEARGLHNSDHHA